jgi:hypothetical protein
MTIEVILVSPWCVWLFDFGRASFLAIVAADGTAKLAACAGSLQQHDPQRTSETSGF